MIKDYRKYHFLEDFLLDEVRSRFLKNGFLTPEEFFSIIIWKANRAKTKTKTRLLSKANDLEKAVKDLTKDVFKAVDDKRRLEILLNDWGFQLPMASAILTILYPKRFTIYDVRVRNQLGIIKDFSKKERIQRYFDEYLPKIKKIAKKNNLSLRDADRCLWGKSFYEDLKKLVEE